MVRRRLQAELWARARRVPVVTLTGPRQSGKTTLVRAAFPKRDYVSLEHPGDREFALADPEGFLAEHGRRVILDEIQRAPALLSYIQILVDERGDAGDFILTGSQQLGLVEAVTQSLAGRTTLLNLLPLDLQELGKFPRAPKTLFDVLVSGSYPAIYDRRQRPGVWLPDYVSTYVERDVRQAVNVRDLATFQTFLQLLAGRTGQILNLSALAADTGITHNTAKAWINVLEASFIVFRVPAYHRSFRKRLVRAPKLHFLDSGLVCFLLGIRHADDLKSHPLRGAIFESWVAAEVLKYHAHRGETARLYYFRDNKGREVDLLVEHGSLLTAVEMKSGQTVSADALASLGSFAELAQQHPLIQGVRRLLVYGGDRSRTQRGTRVISWRKAPAVDWLGAA